MNAPAPGPRPPYRQDQFAWARTASDEVRGPFAHRHHDRHLRPRAPSSGSTRPPPGASPRCRRCALRGEGMVQPEPSRSRGHRPPRDDIEDIFWLQATIAREAGRQRRAGINEQDRRARSPGNVPFAEAVRDGDDPEAIVAGGVHVSPGHSPAAGRIKLAWFLLHVARYLPAQDRRRRCGVGTRRWPNHRELIAARAGASARGAWTRDRQGGFSDRRSGD